MNENKFCFIICTNDEAYLEECIHYVNHLIIPEGFEIDLISLVDAPSITKGYNEGMHATDAKYKIYMHQDVFILNKYLLFDILSIFQQDSTIGMIGMIGYEKVNTHGVMWHETPCGAIYDCQHDWPDINQYKYSLDNDGFNFVSIIDGLFMATAYDLEWDTENLTGWDFYDAFQSMNFLLHNYKIAVPNQKHPWCLHDDKMAPSMFDYNKYRTIFMETHREQLGKHYLDILNAYAKQN